VLSACQRVTIAACCIVLFAALICPYTQSPLPIGNIKMVLFTFAISVLPSAIILLTPDRALALVGALRIGARPNEFTCVRLC
jgi:hypothetical protein